MTRVRNIQSPASARVLALVALMVLALLFAASGAKAAGCAPEKFGPLAPYVAANNTHDDGGPSGESDSIVGLWHVVYTATYTTSGPLPVPVIPPGPPSSFQFLQSYKTWHGDGTEFENAFLPPVGGNVCFGVWKDLGRGTVKLHHIGIMFDPATGAVANIFTVDETNTVAPNGKSYSGYFDFKIFGATDVFGSGAVLQEIKGTTAGTRITVD